MAEYYNAIPDGVIDDRFGVNHSDFKSPEYQTLAKISATKWEECRGLGRSFGYNRAEGEAETIAPDELIYLLVDIVSKNGNLLLDVGPEADGTIPPVQMSRLEALGAWLRINGEAIYGTHPWTRAEGETAEGIYVRFTQKDSALYATLLVSQRLPQSRSGRYLPRVDRRYSCWAMTNRWSGRSREAISRSICPPRFRENMRTFSAWESDGLR